MRSIVLLLYDRLVVEREKEEKKTLLQSLCHSADDISLKRTKKQNRSRHVIYILHRLPSVITHSVALLVVATYILHIAIVS